MAIIGGLRAYLCGLTLMIYQPGLDVGTWGFCISKLFVIVVSESDLLNALAKAFHLG